jgi:hypothetical protein
MKCLFVTMPILLILHGGLCAQLVIMRFFLFRSKTHLPATMRS